MSENCSIIYHHPIVTELAWKIHID